MTTPVQTAARAPLTVSVTPTSNHARTTPTPADRRFGEHLAHAAEQVGQLATALAGVAELASVRVATAPTGPRSTAPWSAAPEPSPVSAPLSADAGVGDPALYPWAASGSVADRSLYYLQLQERVSAEHRHYTTLSNVMKARHDTAKVAINNIG